MTPAPPTRSALPILLFGAIALIGAIVLVGTDHVAGAYVDTLFGIAGAALTAAAGLTVPHLGAANDPPAAAPVATPPILSTDDPPADDPPDGPGVGAVPPPRRR